MVFSFLLSAFAFAQESNQHPFQLGKGYDLSKLSTWDFSTGLTHRNVLRWDGQYIGPECHSRNRDCVPTFGSKINQFQDLRSIFNYFESETSGELSVRYMSFWASIKGAQGQKNNNYWFSNMAGAVGVAENLQGCHAIDDDCLYEFPGYQTPLSIDPVFNFTLHRMVRSGQLNANGDNEKVLDLWSRKIIRHRGTHLCRRTDNGAAIKTYTHTDQTGSAVAQCAYQRICLGLGAYGLNLTACSKQSGCSAGAMNKIHFEANCAAVGGGRPEDIVRICNKDTPVEVRQQFLSSGNLDESSSVIAMYFTRLDTILEQFGYDTELTMTVGKAIDYHLCKSQIATGVWKWNTREGKCQCNRECHNGGKRDDVTCTCTCRGNNLHGWRGETCEETYGFCQPGHGTGNPAAAQACNTSNQCSSALHQNSCRPTDVCCLTDINGKCCPFGYSCRCGVDNCDCVRPRNLEDRLSTQQFSRGAPKNKTE